jgi:hypothetical protein
MQSKPQSDLPAHVYQMSYPVRKDKAGLDRKSKKTNNYAEDIFMKKAILLIFVIILWGAPGMAEEYVIIKDSLFGTQKIEIYQSLNDALGHYSGEGKIYKMTRKEIQVKRVSSRKRVEVTEYNWIADEKKTDKPTK